MLESTSTTTDTTEDISALIAHDFEENGLHFAIIAIEPSYDRPVRFAGMEFIRVGENVKPLKDLPEPPAGTSSKAPSHYHSNLRNKRWSYWTPTSTTYSRERPSPRVRRK